MAYSQTKLYYPPDACEVASQLFVYAYNLHTLKGLNDRNYPKGRFRVSPGLQVIVGSSMQGKSHVAALWDEKLFRPKAEADELDVAYARAGDADTGCLGSEVAEVLLGSLLTKRSVDEVADAYELSDRHRASLDDAVDKASWERFNHPGSVYILDSIRDLGRWEKLGRDIGAAAILETVTTSRGATKVDTHTVGTSHSEGKSNLTPGIVTTTSSQSTSKGASNSTSGGGVSESYSFPFNNGAQASDPRSVSISSTVTPSSSKSESETRTESTSTSKRKGVDVTKTVTSGGTESRTDGLNVSEGTSTAVRHALDRTGQPGGLSQGFIDLLIRIDLYARQLGIYLVVVANPLLSDSVGLRFTFSGTCAGAYNVGPVQDVRRTTGDNGIDVASRLRYYLDPTDPLNEGADCSNGRSIRIESGSHTNNKFLFEHDDVSDSTTDLITDTDYLEG